MNRLNKIRFLEIMAATVAAILLGFAAFYAFFLPDTYRADQEEGFLMANPLISATPTEDTVVVSSTGTQKQSYTLQFLGVVPIKTVTISTEESVKLIPSGEPLGVKMFAKEPVVVGMETIESTSGAICPGEEAGLQVGDRIQRVNEKTVERNEEVAALIQTSNGDPVTVTVLRGEETFETTIHPVYSESAECYQSGLWIRDSAAGIGTITFWNPQNQTFGGLGHGICDNDTGDMMTVGSGEICDVFIHSARKGTSGNPGELYGAFLQDEATGSIWQNNETGIFGDWYPTLSEEDAIDIAYQQEITCGDASILCTVEGEEPKEYAAKITAIDYNTDHATKNLVVEIIDEELLSTTGGIVQGMSGSPILQNGKLVGAVTHVFVNDPTRGYGIFIENMLESAA